MHYPSNENPLVSIGCAVYNGEKTLGRALDKLIEQDYQNLEIIICDDGSTDSSPEICQEYASKDARILYMRNDENLGIIENCNKLFRLSSGKYFMWADQDDVRDVTFVSKAVAILESDEHAVLCHCYTGVFKESDDELEYYSTMDHVDAVRNPLLRYCRFLRTFNDCITYGLLRSSALAKTSLWHDDSGSANALLFELLLLGSFRQVPEILYFYQSKGLKNRPSPEQEYERHNGGRSMPWYYLPFIAVAKNQTLSILRMGQGFRVKSGLLLFLWFNVVMTVLGKLIYRVVKKLTGNHIPESVTNLCLKLVQNRSDIHPLIPDEEFEANYPRTWVLKSN